MSKKILIAAQRAEHVRVAIVDGTTLEDYQVELAEAGLCRGNIYRGVVANVQASLNAAFVDIGEERHGFLSIDDVLTQAYHKKPPKDEKRPRIDQVLERGKPILVQVAKDGVGQKGPALTTNLSLAGRYLVLTPFGETRGISRKVEDEQARRQVKERLKELNLPEGHGVIVRTNGLEQNKTTLNRDLSALLRLWKRVKGESSKGKGVRLLYSDQDLTVQVLRDYLDNTIDEVLVDDDDVYEKAETYMRAFMPRSKTKLTRYKERLPLLNRFHLEPQIDRIYERTVPLQSGGSIVIDGTEALTAIDVNSGRATKVTNHDESILNVNVEAAEEVARQLRLRDIGGLVVVDFIDMRLRKHQRKLEKVMRDAMKSDRARSSVGRISANGLLEINRQRLKQAIRTRTHRPCPTCSGVGTIPSPDFISLSLLSRIEARAASGIIRTVTIALHPEIADALQNGYRHDIAALEDEFDLEIHVISAPNLHRIEERVEWGRAPSGSGVDTKARAAALKAVDLAPPGDQRGRRRPPAPPKSGKPADEPVKAADAAQAGGPDDDAGEELSTPTRSRRRRRGGRRRKRAASSQAAGNKGPESKAEAPADQEAEHAAGESGPGQDQKAAKGGERKDGRGRKAQERGPKNRGDQPADESARSAEPRQDERAAPRHEGEQSAAPPSDGDNGGQRSRRRRRGGRRRKRPAAGDGHAGDNGQGESLAGSPQTDIPEPPGSFEVQPPIVEEPVGKKTGKRWNWWSREEPGSPGADES